MKRLLLILTILLFSAFAVIAQDNESSNDPRTNENANACFAGGTMEGKCNVDFDGNGTVDTYEVNWAWECGWYIIRYDAAMITNGQVPVRCHTLFSAGLLCFNIPWQPGASIQYTGNPNTPGNVVFIAAPNCAGTAEIIGQNSMLIFAGSQEEAEAICAQYFSTYGVAELRSVGYDAAPGMYGCDGL